VVELHEDASFSLHGRLADLVNIAGKRTSLVHLNYHLNAVPGVRDGVFFLPGDRGQRVTRLTAFVVAPGHSAKTILADLRQRIDSAFMPRPLHLVDALPRNSTGKLTQQQLAALWEELTKNTPG
jgi:acyl-coenzyme A synthetase/AMP-(fatty) acid ligase